jgi:stage III sporulation protein AF
MSGAKTWLLSVLVVSVFCAIAESFAPRGPVRQVVGLACGLALLGTVAAPIARLDLSGGEKWLSAYFSGLSDQTGALEETVNQAKSAVIKGQYEAYIEDKAAELGVACGVSVTCRADADGLLLPESVEISGLNDRAVREQLSRTLQEELGVPPERQRFVNGEEAT